MKLFDGTAEMAIRSGAEIVPVAMECYNNNMYVAIGENMDIIGYSLENKKQLTLELRDALATLKYHIIEKQGICRRKDIPDDYKDRFIDGIINGNKEMSYTVEDVIKTRYVDKRVTEREVAFSYLNNIITSRNSAFLFDKRIRY